LLEFKVMVASLLKQV